MKTTNPQVSYKVTLRQVLMVRSAIKSDAVCYHYRLAVLADKKNDSLELWALLGPENCEPKQSLLNVVNSKENGQIQAKIAKIICEKEKMGYKLHEDYEPSDGLMYLNKFKLREYPVLLNVPDLFDVLFGTFSHHCAIPIPDGERVLVELEPESIQAQTASGQLYHLPDKYSEELLEDLLKTNISGCYLECIVTPDHLYILDVIASDNLFLSVGRQLRECFIKSNFRTNHYVCALPSFRNEAAPQLLNREIIDSSVPDPVSVIILKDDSGFEHSGTGKPSTDAWMYSWTPQICLIVVGQKKGMVVLGYQEQENEVKTCALLPSKGLKFMAGDVVSVTVSISNKGIEYQAVLGQAEYISAYACYSPRQQLGLSPLSGAEWVSPEPDRFWNEW